MEAVRSLPNKDPRLTLRAIAEQLKIGKDIVSTIIHGDLNRRKIYARFVPYFLTPEQKEMHVNCCRDFVETADKDPDFIKTIVTSDETWCFMYDPQTKRQSSA